ncbi:MULTISPECIES: thiopeptide-type bacteriocin biosynthesis protein [unclassified Streptosporangium]|uniref:thiopeptide-type bacteriocin biosynthesis protein n=1 Tax=unclassified Streptosporangium TaxID=2632669 RepID=UPI002E2DA240|nr:MULTISPECIES: thiopeptide-type bacteriocin biosynthesis protein [unclassified Streptosporangium]
MDPCSWHQINVAFPDWAGAEHAALAHLVPLLIAAERDGLLTSWFFIRKKPCWRVRFLPGGDTSGTQAYIHHHLEDLKKNRHIDDAREIVYEPETHAFGGAEGMACAHRLFHLDSRHLLAHLADTGHLPGAGHRRELSILLCSTLLRTAGLDWYEQGDVWARVADHREPPGATFSERLHADLQHLMSVDTASLTREGSPLPHAPEWTGAFAVAGQDLAGLSAAGLLRRGLRAVLAHHIIFVWNRFGLPHATQAVLAATAKTVVFGADPRLTGPP